MRRRFARTSGGTFGFVASSSNGSPGASASTVNSTMLIPRRLGIAMSRRRVRYRLKDAAHASRYQSFSVARSLSQPLISSRILFETAATFGRYTTGITAWSEHARSLMRMNSAARLTGSSSALRRAVGLVDLVVAASA